MSFTFGIYLFGQLLHVDFAIDETLQNLCGFLQVISSKTEIEPINKYRANIIQYNRNSLR
jgi:hypothetical protein